MVDEKPGGPIGRGNDQGGEGNWGGDGGAAQHCSPPRAGVVIRATVEHIGLVGDTELTVNVKWPASTFCIPQYGKPAVPPGEPTDSQQVPDNGPHAKRFDALTGEAIDSPKPD